MNTTERIASAIFGAFLAGVGAYVVFFSGAPLHWALLAGIALILLGGNLVYSAYRCTPSWLARIGPLP